MADYDDITVFTVLEADGGDIHRLSTRQSGDRSVFGWGIIVLYAGLLLRDNNSGAGSFLIIFTGALVAIFGLISMLLSKTTVEVLVSSRGVGFATTQTIFSRVINSVSRTFSIDDICGLETCMYALKCCHRLATTSSVLPARTAAFFVFMAYFGATSETMVVVTALLCAVSILYYCR